MKNHHDPSRVLGQLVDLQSFRRKRSEEETLVRGRDPLYKSHNLIKLSHVSPGGESKLSDFSERIARIRTSLDKISALMSDLKKLSSKQQP